MRRLLGCLIIAVLALILTSYIYVMRVTSTEMRTGQEASRQALADLRLDCPQSGRRISRPWSKAGWMIFCERQGLPHGPWLTAKNGRLAIRGTFQEGERAGTWEWYGEDGEVVRRQTY
jgi:hypothetical protein